MDAKWLLGRAGKTGQSYVRPLFYTYSHVSLEDKLIDCNPLLNVSTVAASYSVLPNTEMTLTVAGHDRPQARRDAARRLLSVGLQLTQLTTSATVDDLRPTRIS